MYEKPSAPQEIFASYSMVSGKCVDFIVKLLKI